MRASSNLPARPPRCRIHKSDCLNQHVTMWESSGIMPVQAGSSEGHVLRSPSPAASGIAGFVIFSACECRYLNFHSLIQVHDTFEHTQLFEPKTGALTVSLKRPAHPEWCICMMSEAVDCSNLESLALPGDHQSPLGGMFKY